MLFAAAALALSRSSRDRNRHIHSPRDTLEVSSNNAAHAAKFARLGAAYAIELAKGTLAPAESLMSSTADAGETPRAIWRLLALLFAVAAFALYRSTSSSIDD